MEKPRIIVDAAIPFVQGILEPHAELRYLPGKQIDHAACMQADALIVRTRTACTEALLANTPVRHIASATIGLDHIDVNYCAAHGIAVANAPGANAWAVVQWVLAAMLRIDKSSTYSFPQWTVGIVGHGQIGRRLSSMLALYGIQTLVCDPFLEKENPTEAYVPLARIARDCDVITLHVPHTTDGPHPTHHLLGKSFFRSMLHHNRPYILNSSRGGVVDDFQLLDALEYKRIRGYCLDVYEDEPDVAPELLERALVCTPHVAGYSTEGKLEATRMALTATCNFFNLPALTPAYAPVTTDKQPNTLTIAGHSLLDLRGMYDIAHDSITLRKAPHTFESLRDGYAYRHDLRGYTIAYEPLRTLVFDKSY